MKLYVPDKGDFYLSLVANATLGHARLMSDYEVNLVNDSMQEFFVRFYGPKESASTTSVPPVPLRPIRVSG